MEPFSSLPGHILQQATPLQLQLAAAQNHTELFDMNARSMGGEVITKGGLTWTFDGAGKGAMVPFPVVTVKEPGMLFDEMMTYYREHQPRGVGCWSLDPPATADINALLLARGFQPGWKPCWMALDLTKIKTGYNVPASLEIKADNDTDTTHIKDLPYNGHNGAVSVALLKKYPHRAQRFVASLNGEIVGHSVVFYNSGDHGAAGIYNVGVVPHARNLGIGKAVVTAACLHAKEKGYGYAVLNATGLPMYQQIGFEWVGYGLTWWITNKNYITAPPSPSLIALTEAACKGDMTAVKETAASFTTGSLDTPLANGMTLLQLAVHCKQHAVAEWLVHRGVTCTVMDAWDLGWKEQAASILAKDPQEVNRRYDHWQYTLLHIAAERNDIALAQLALSAHPDLTIKDKVYHGTALGWAEHMDKNVIIQLIRDYMKARL